MNGNASLAPAHTIRMSHGRCKPVTPTPTCRVVQSATFPPAVSETLGGTCRALVLTACPLTAQMVIFLQRKIARVTWPPPSRWAVARCEHKTLGPWIGRGMNDSPCSPSFSASGRNMPSQPLLRSACRPMSAVMRVSERNCTDELTPAQKAGDVGSAVRTTTRTRSSRSKRS